MRSTRPVAQSAPCGTGLASLPASPRRPAPSHWTTDTLRQVLEETLELATLRAVDTETLGEAAQYLPALYLAFNAHDEAVSTDFAPLTP
jgi:hypothetical protein